MATAATKTKLLTAEEFFEFVHRPENHDRFFELDRGEIVEMPLPKRPHGHVCGNAAWLLGSYARQRKRGDVCANDTGFILERDPDTVRGPDVTFYDDELTFEEMPQEYVSQPPQVAIEVLSPNATWAKTNRRVTQFLKAGVAFVWVIDPEDQTVTVHRRGRDPLVLQATEELTGEDVLPDFRCKVAEFFAVPSQS